MKENPKVFCLDVLRDYKKMVDVEESLVEQNLGRANGTMDMMDQELWEKRNQALTTYCGRYDIYYNPYRERMQ